MKKPVIHTMILLMVVVALMLTGCVTSGIKTFGASTGYPSNAMEHNAYMDAGSSGGAAIDEDMKLVGITPGVVTSFDRNSVDRGVLIPASEIRLCLDEWKEEQ